MRIRLLLLLTVLAFVFIKGNCQTPAWAISGPFTTISTDNSDHLFTVNKDTLTKYDTSANILWSHSYGAAIEDVVSTSDSKLYIAGSFKGTVQLGGFLLNTAAAGSVYVAQLNSEGTVEWARKVETTQVPASLQVATDSKGSVYIGWIEGLMFKVARFWPEGTLRFTQLFQLGSSPYGEPVNTISVDKQDNLHVFYSSPYVSNPVEPLNTINAQSRAWFDSTGVQQGTDRNLKSATRDVFRGYKAGLNPGDYIYTKTFHSITGYETTWLSNCSSFPGHCYAAPPINPGYDQWGNAYYAGYFYVLSYGLNCERPPATLTFSCANAVSQKPEMDQDIYVQLGDTLLSTRDNGMTDEYALRLAVDPHGQALYILASWYPRGTDTARFYFGSSVLAKAGHMVLRYRVDRPAIPVTAGPDKVICLGGSATIGASDMVSDGKAPFTYSWQPTAALSNPGLPNPVASPLASTDYIVTVTDATGAIGQDTVRVVVDKDLYRPSVSLVSGVNPFCAGDTIVLKASEATRYEWSNGATTQATRITATESLVVNTVNEEGCRGTSLPYNAVRNPLPPVPTLTQHGNTLEVESPAASYQWYFNGQLLNETSGPSMTIKQGGEYRVVITDNNGCRNTGTLTAIKRRTDAQIDYQVYPNPVTGDLNIVYTLKEAQPVSITLRDVPGHNVLTVLERRNQPAGEYQYSVNNAAARLQKGVYFVVFQVGNRRIVEKIVVH